VSPSVARSTGSRRVRRAVLVGGLLAGASVLLSGCSPADIPRMLDISTPVTKEGQRIYDLWQGSWVAAWAVGALTWGLILWAVVAYRRRAPQAPAQTRYNLPIEAMYTILPLIVIAVLFGYTARDQTELLKVSAKPQNTVNVVAFRWSWTFNYVDENTYDVGTPAGPLPTLYLPVGETVKFELTSPDVIHSFWVPAFLFKMDVIPGKTNQFELTPTKLGTYSGKCAELCGVDHSRMLFVVKVVTPEEFASHMAELKASGNVGLLDTGRVTDSVTGDVQGRTTIGGSS
jgi:cytochrome c oxidase subunit II